MSRYEPDGVYEEDDLPDAIEMHECIGDDPFDDQPETGGPIIPENFVPTEWHGQLSGATFRQYHDGEHFVLGVTIEAERPVLVTRQVRTPELLGSHAAYVDFALAVARDDEAVSDRIVLANPLPLIDIRDFLRASCDSLLAILAEQEGSVEPSVEAAKYTDITRRSISRLGTIAKRIDMRLTRALPAQLKAWVDPADMSETWH